MNQLTKALFVITLSLSGLYSCSALKPYQVPVLQGNIIEDKDIEQLVKGLTKDQAMYLLGTPLLNSPLHPQRWDYFYSVTIGDTIFGERKLTLFFSPEGILESWILEDLNPAET